MKARLIPAAMAILAAVSVSACTSELKGQTLVGVAKVDNVTNKPFAMKYKGKPYCDYKDRHGRPYQSPCP